MSSSSNASASIGVVSATFTSRSRRATTSGPVDPDATARFVLAALDGGRSASVVLGDHEDPVAVRAGLNEFVLDSLRQVEESDAAADTRHE